MNNLDANGFELPWELEVQKEFTSNITKYRIIPNPLWKHNNLNSPEFALMSCFRDAVINMNSKASQAIMLHIRDAHKWTKE
jgi:hypothetical protein